MIAIGVIAIAAAGLMAIFAFGIRLSADARRTTNASFEAQLQMEQLIGLDWDFLQTARNWNNRSDSGREFWVHFGLEEYAIHPPYLRLIDATTGNLVPNTDPTLIEVYVRIYQNETSTDFLIQQRKILNVRSD